MGAGIPDKCCFDRLRHVLCKQAVQDAFVHTSHDDQGSVRNINVWQQQELFQL